MAKHLPVPDELLHLVEKRDQPERRKAASAPVDAAAPAAEKRRRDRRTGKRRVSE